MAMKIRGPIEVSGTTTFSGTKTFSGLYVPGSTGITAFASGGQSGATQLTSSTNVITTCATALDSVKLPDISAAGDTVTIVNNGVADLAVYPYDGETIGGLSADALWPIHPGCSQIFTATSTTAWMHHKTGLKYVPRTGTVNSWKASGGIATMTIDGTVRELTSAPGETPRSAWGYPAQFRIYLARTVASLSGLKMMQYGGAPTASAVALFYQTYGAHTLRSWVGCVPSDSSGRFMYSYISATPTSYDVSIIGYWVIG